MTFDILRQSCHNFCNVARFYEFFLWIYSDLLFNNHINFPPTLDNIFNNHFFGMILKMYAGTIAKQLKSVRCNFFKHLTYTQENRKRKLLSIDFYSHYCLDQFSNSLSNIYFLTALIKYAAIQNSFQRN